MTRRFNELIDRVCCKCGEMRPGRLYSYGKRENLNEIVFYQRADCKICRSESEKQRRKNNAK